MKLNYVKKTPGKDKLDALTLLLSENSLKPPKGLDAPLASALKQGIDLKEFSGKKGESLTLFTSSKQIPRLVLVGLGKADEIDQESLRRAAGKTVQHLKGMNVAKAGIWIPERAGKVSAGDLVETVAEGACLGAYEFKQYKQAPAAKEKPSAELKQVTLYEPSGKGGNKAADVGQMRAGAVRRARDLGDQPANAMTPSQLAAEAKTIAKKHGLRLKVIEKTQMERMGMGLFMGVAQGSRQPPKMIVLEYRPAGAKQTLAFVGKGITFDSGGISLKPGAAMDEMKFDMCGAAAVLGAMDAIGTAKPKVNVVGIIPACENLPDGEAVKPGDILKSYAGKHVEVLNTDAEGRLVLADALAYGIKEFKPDAVVNLATLTGACVVALGHYATGAIGNHDGLMERVTGAGRGCGEIVWPLPNFPEYGEELKGKYADLQNIGSRYGGAITGGLFLKEFVGDVPWVHLDIAGTAWGVKNIGHIPNEGATGVGVRLLLDLAQNWKPL